MLGQERHVLKRLRFGGIPVSSYEDRMRHVSPQGRIADGDILIVAEELQRCP